jgi:acyl-coenzyme A thioesterase PaaI-like protein
VAARSMAGGPFMSAANKFHFTPYAPSVPFERLAGPYQVARDGAALVLGLQTQAHHAGIQGQIHPAAIAAFGDFALYALINHHSGGAYANRIPSDEETIVTLSADVELLGTAAIGETLIARGHVFRESKRLFGVRTIISTLDGRPVARIGGLWSRTIMPARIEGAAPASCVLPVPTGQTFRSHLGAEKLPMAVCIQHCNDLSISHGGCLLALAVFAAEDAILQTGKAAQLVSFHAAFLAPGRAEQSLDVDVTLTDGHAGLIHADGAVKACSQPLMSFHSISCAQ